MSEADDAQGVMDVPEQIERLESNHAEAIAAISALNQRSYVYVPRERYMPDILMILSKRSNGC